jgi:DNA-binding PadR family transcriptional regulator
MKWTLGFLLLVGMAPTFAEVSHGEVESMLNQMVKENVISAAEAEKAKIKMKHISPDQWKQINETAQGVAARSPASVPSSNNINEVHKVDLDGEQFKQIQQDIKRIIPESR